jgi:hypothetical protein
MLACLAFAPIAPGIAADDEATSPFDEAVERGLYKEANSLAQRELLAIADNADFRSKDVRARYFDAIRNAQIWARWNEALRLLEALEAGMLGAAPAADADWIELQVRSISLHSDLHDYARSDRAYAEGRLEVSASQLERAPAFERLVHAQSLSLMQQQRWWDASELLQERLRWLEQHDPSNAIEIGSTLTYLGELSDTENRWQARAAYLQRAEQILERAYRARKPTREAATGMITAWAFTASGVRDYRKWDECTLRGEWIAAAEAEFGAANARLVTPLVDAASYCEEEIQDSERERMFERALTIAQQTWGEQHPEFLYALEHQGIYYASRDSESKNARGERLLAQMAAIRERVYRDAPLTLLVASLYDLSNEPPDSCRQFASGRCAEQIERSLDQLTQAWGENHPALAELRLYVATRLHFGSSADSEADGNAREAFVEGQCRLALASSSASSGAEHPQTARIARECADYALSVGNYEQARNLSKRAAAIYRKHFGASDGATVQAEVTLQRNR